MQARARSMSGCLLAGVLALLAACPEVSTLHAAGLQKPVLLQDGAYHVHPGGSIQEALEAAARNPSVKVVRVHEGEYRPDTKRQALIWLNRIHDGIRVEAVGHVVLSAANSTLSDTNDPAYPAVVNHVVYFGDGISSNTVLKGFEIAGANGFVTRRLTRQIEPDDQVPKNLFFFTDGGGVKVFGRSYPTLLELFIRNNYSSPCGAGISIQHEGHNQQAVLIQDCLFFNNKARVTGSAIDLLQGSAARIVNCLIVGNASNMGTDIVALRSGESPFVNSGVLTIFQHSRAWIERCTFQGNRNGVDDMGGLSSYADSIFYGNRLDAGLPGHSRYELDLQQGGTVSRCFIQGSLLDPLKAVAADRNRIDAPDPEFDENHVPRNPEYQGVGFRPEGLLSEMLRRN